MPQSSDESLTKSRIGDRVPRSRNDFCDPHYFGVQMPGVSLPRSSQPRNRVGRPPELPRVLIFTGALESDRVRIDRSRLRVWTLSVVFPGAIEGQRRRKRSP